MKNKQTNKTTYLTLVTAMTVGMGAVPMLAQANEQATIELSSTKTTASFILNDWTYTEDADSITLTKYKGTETSLYVPGEYNGKRVFIPNFKIFPSTMTELTLEEVNGVKVGLGTTDLTFAFCDNTTITSLDLRGLDTSQVTDMSYMFHSAENLIALDVSNWDTTNVTNMAGMFGSTKKLTALDVSNWDTSSVTNMRAIFGDAQSLTTLDVSNWNTSNVTDMRGVFSDTFNLTTLDVSNWDTSNVTDMSQMFSCAQKLTTLDLNNWDTSNVTNMSEMFRNAYDLTTLEISNWDTSNVTRMTLMFSATNLTHLDLSRWDTSSVTSMNKMFSGTNNLVFLDLSNWDTSNLLVKQQMFWCYSTQPLTLVTDNMDFKKHDFNADNRIVTLWTKPVIDAQNILIHTGDTFYPLEYAIATDYEDGDIVLTEANVIFNNVDVSQPGIYQVTYKVTDNDGLTTTKVVPVTVNAKPQFIGNDNFLIMQGDMFNPLDGLLAYDEEDGYIDLTEDNIIFNNVDSSQSGTYHVIYEVTDQHGGTTQKEVSVIVNAIPLIEASDVVLTVGDVFNPLDYATVIDDETIILTESNVIFNNVDTSKSGVYKVTYQVNDCYGAIGTKTIQVVVQEKVIEETESDHTNGTNSSVGSGSNQTNNNQTNDKPVDNDNKNNEVSDSESDNKPTSIADKDIIETGLSNQITLLIGLFSLFQGLVFWKRKNQ